MKKILTTTLLSAIAIAANAQEKTVPYDPFRDRDLVHNIFQVTAIVAIIYLIANWLLNMIRSWLEYRLKNRMMDKGASEFVITQFLQPQKKDTRTTAIKWSIISGGIGLGFALMFLFPPFGIHSVMIMSFCISLSFLSYYYFIKKEGN
ncbi:MAG: hypothetical protein EOO02_12370 [Chitinophagaceae bacterium]|nr:MAG: hypothetical protein EOO02_12370 [Chitinophagaceae bacterium]